MSERATERDEMRSMSNDKLADLLEPHRDDGTFQKRAMKEAARRLRSPSDRGGAAPREVDSLRIAKDEHTGVRLSPGSVGALLAYIDRLRAASTDAPSEERDGLLAQESLLVSNSQSPHRGHRCAVRVNPVEEDWGPMKLTEPVAVAWADEPGVATAVALRRADAKLRAPTDEAPEGNGLDEANIDGIIATLNQQARSSDEAPYDTPPLSAPFLRGVVKLIRRLRQPEPTREGFKVSRGRGLVRRAHETIGWAVDLLEMYDEKLIEMGEPESKVRSPAHLNGIAEARRVQKLLKRELEPSDG